MTDAEQLRLYELDISNLLNPTGTEGIHVKVERGIVTNSGIYLSGNCSWTVRQQINVKAQLIREIHNEHPETMDYTSVRVTWGASLQHPAPAAPLPPQWPPTTPPPIMIPPQPIVPIACGTEWIIA